MKLLGFACVFGILSSCAAIEATLRPSIVSSAPKAPMLPLSSPTESMKGGKGGAEAPYPKGYGATVKPDGTIGFPEGTMAKVKGANIVIGAEPIVTVSEDGEVKGSGLKKRYRFAADGALLDEEGHGVRIAPDGGVRALGGPYRAHDVFVWTLEAGGSWDKSGWRTLSIVSLVVIENMLPQALKPEAATKAKEKEREGGIYIPPPSQWFK